MMIFYFGVEVEVEEVREKRGKSTKSYFLPSATPLAPRQARFRLAACITLPSGAKAVPVRERKSCIFCA